MARSIPRFMDGLKQVQRKIIWGSMKKWSKAKKKEKVKVMTLCSYISTKTQYHHGDKSMCDAIVHMVHDFVGTNNLPTFEANGQFGTRDLGGKDCAAPRYTRTRPLWWWNHIFKKEDNPLLTMVVDEGEVCEPVTLLPVLPLHLINGVKGIGTGHSTFIPNHDPLDICKWLTARLNGWKVEPIVPWYRGFTGEIKIEERKAKAKSSSAPSTPSAPNTPSTPDALLENSDENDEDNEDDVAINENTRYTMKTIGKFREEGKRTKKVVVTELPIGKPTHDYEVWLRRQRELKVIKGFTNYSKHDTVHFEITGIKNPSVTKLKLEKKFGMSNMVLLDLNNRPVKYNTTTDILESFYHLRLPYYQKRKDNILEGKQDKTNLLNNKIKFILSVIKGFNLVKTISNLTIEQANNEGAILSIGLNKKQIQPQMEKLGFGYDLLQKVSLHQCTEEEVEKARHQLNKLEEEINNLKEISPEKMWQKDIDEFVAAYCKHYKCDPLNWKKNVKMEVNPDELDH